MSRGAKPWKLTEEETFSSFSSWKNNLVFNLRKEKDFKQFLKEDAPTEWESLTSQNPKRGFAGGQAEETATNLNSMLGYIASYSPSFLATDIEKNCTSIDSVWQCIREYFRFGQSEVQFMKLLTITREENERPQRLYQRILAHLQDNLLQKDSKLKHNGKIATKNEDMSPTIERIAVLRWLELLHPKIPALVQRTFAYDLQRSTLKDLQPQIADALDGLMDEIHAEEECKADRTQTSLRHVSSPMYQDDEEDIQAARAYVPPRMRSKPGFRPSFRPQQFRPRPNNAYKQCIMCKKMGKKQFNHSLAECDLLSPAEKRFAIRSLTVNDDVEDLVEELLSLEQQDE
jgi:hypothetical protein